MSKDCIKFSLDKPNADKPTYIFLRYPCKDGYLKYATKLSVLPSNWDKANQEIKGDKETNLKLSRIYGIVADFLDYNRIIKKDEPIYKRDIIEELNDKLSRKERVRTSHFFDCIDTLIQEAKEGTLLTDKLTIYTAGTIKGWQKVRNRLFEFDPNLSFSTISLDTYNQLINWCNAQKYTLNYTSSIIKNLKTFMTLAISKGWSKNMIHNHRDFKKVTEESFQVYLNDDEIMKLFNLDISSDKYREQIRDRFIINLYTGFRVSDMKTFNLSNFQNEIIMHINQKTGKTVVMPIHDIINSIISKYNGKLPKQYADQVINREIKEIARDAGITDIVMFTKTVGGVKTKFRKFKYEMITNHTARRSLATNLLKHADFADVMPVMGMSYKTLQGYNKRSAEENAHMLKDNPFFRKAAK